MGTETVPFELASEQTPSEFAKNEPVRVGGVEAMGVMEARVPAFRRRPIERELEVGFPHLAHDETFVAQGVAPTLRPGSPRRPRRR
jgi:hypothetical protein